MSGEKCPTCKMVVDAKNECPFCYTTLTYEPICADEHEHLVWNKYLFLYLANNIWFSLLCCIIGAIKLFMVIPTICGLWVFAAVLALVSLTVSISKRHLCKLLTWKYSDKYAIYKIGIWKYLFGGASIILFCLA